MIETTCENCATLIRVADAAAGKSGNCPGCGRPVTIPGLEQTAENEDGRFTWKSAFEEPVVAGQGSRFRTALHHTRIPGIWLLVVYGLIGGNFHHYKPTATVIIGRHADWPPPTVIAWFAGMMLFNTLLGLGTAGGIWCHFTGHKTYSEDRAEFARAGGYDIGRWVPILAALLLWVVYWQTRIPDGSDPIALIRGPWIFAMLSGFFGFVATIFVAIVVFNARYGKSSKS